MVIKITTLKVKGASVKGDATLTGTVPYHNQIFAEDLVWTLNGVNMGLAPGVSSAVDLPALPKDPAHVVMMANFKAVQDGAASPLTVHSATMASVFTYTSAVEDDAAEPSITAVVSMDAPYPCVPGMSYVADANVTMKNFKDVKNLDDLATIAMKANMFCKPEKDMPAFKLFGSIPSIKIKKNEIVDVEMEINAFNKKGVFTFVGTGTGSVVKEDMNMEGSVKGDMTNAAAFSFSTQGDTIGFMMELQWSSEKFTATMMAAVVQGPCDRILGVAMTGDALVTIDYSNGLWQMPFNLTLEGAKHCGMHIKQMEDDKESAGRFFDNYQRFIAQEGVNATGRIMNSTKYDDDAFENKGDSFTAMKLMEVALSNRDHPNLPSFPQFQFSGQLTESTEVFPTIFLKDAKVGRRRCRLIL